MQNNTYYSARSRWTKQQQSRSVKILTGTPTVKIPLGRLRNRWVDNIRMDLKEIGINIRNLIDWAQDRDY